MKGKVHRLPLNQKLKTELFFFASELGCQKQFPNLVYRDEL